MPDNIPMSHGNLCTMGEALSSTHGPSIVCLTRGERIGLTFVATSGFISLIAILGAFVQIFRNAIRTRTLIRQPADLYMLSLFSFDLVAALGTVIYVKWIHDGRVYTGGFCTAEGIIVQLGLAGSALATLAIAVHTFIVVMWGQARKHQYVIASIVVALTWLFLAFFITISVSVHTHGPYFYYTPVGSWCWINNQYKAEQYAGQYIWIWVAMFVSFLTYVPLFFWARGNISVSPSHWWKFRVQTDGEVVQDADPDGRRRRSIGMIAYPVVFAVVALPFSVIRWRTNFGSAANRLPTATFVVYSIFGLSGAFNVLLFLFTRPELLLPRNVMTNSTILPVASGVSLSESDSVLPEMTRGDRPLALGALPGANDMGRHLLTSEQGSG